MNLKEYMNSPLMSVDEFETRHQNRLSSKSGVMTKIKRFGAVTLASAGIGGVSYAVIKPAFDPNDYCVTERIVPNDSQRTLLNAINVTDGYVSHQEVGHIQTPSGAFIVQGEWCGQGQDPITQTADTVR